MLLGEGHEIFHVRRTIRLANTFAIVVPTQVDVLVKQELHLR